MTSLFRAWVGSLLLMLVVVLAVPDDARNVIVAGICLAWTIFAIGAVSCHVLGLFTGPRGRGE